METVARALAFSRAIRRGLHNIARRKYITVDDVADAAERLLKRERGITELTAPERDLLMTMAADALKRRKEPRY